MGLGALWLLSYKVESVSGRRAFLTAAGILTVMCVVSGIWYSQGLNFYGTPRVVCVLGALAVLPAMAAARFFCRKRYSATRFMSWLFLWLILIFTCLAIPFAAINHQLSDRVLGIMPAVGAGIGLVMYIILLPFMLLTFLNSFYRARFHSIFRFEETRSEVAKEV